jgi:hypothetical protein
MKYQTIEKLTNRQPRLDRTQDPDVLYHAIRRLWENGRLDTFDVMSLGMWLSGHRKVRW